ncbi:MAG TPA: hypothetical protein VEP30_09020 [Chthoniobacterales bacterium]|nr:hypothetical protein [Chthoniobacterales bacterium]
MNKIVPLITTVSVCLALAGLTTAAKPKKTSTKSDKVMEVDRVAVSYIKTNPPQLKIEAEGKTNTGGWTNPRLVERVYIVPPADGMWEYDFVATPPSGISTQVITPISAHTVRRDIPPGMKGVRVHASKNSKDAKLEHPAAEKKP